MAIESGFAGEQQAAPERPVAPPPAPRPRRRPIEDWASWSYRAGAELVDLALCYAGVFAAGAVIGLTGGSEHSATLVGWIVFAALWVIDFVVIAGLTRGQTLGKRLAGIRVIRENGEPYGMPLAFVRDVIGRLLFLIPLFFLADSLAPLGAERQTLRDRMVGTRVERLPVYRARRWPLAAAGVLSAGVVVVVVAFGIASRSKPIDGTDGYTTFEREAFIAGCAKDGTMTRPECGCAFDRISARLPHRDFEQANATDEKQWPRRTSHVIANAIVGCSGSGGGGGGGGSGPDTTPS